MAFLGNPILGNDAVGIRVGKRLAKEPFHISTDDHCCTVDVAEIGGSPMNMLATLSRYTNIILIDSIVADELEPGTVVSFTRQDLERFATSPAHPHGMNIPEVLQLARRFGLDRWENFCLVGIAVRPNFRFQDCMDTALETAEGRIYDDVRGAASAFITKWQQNRATGA